jgi:hypothetical protein
MRLFGLVVCVAAVVAVLVLGECTESAKDKFNADVRKRDISLSQVAPGNKLGGAVCKDIHNGNAAASEVIGVTNDAHWTESQAEIVVYYAITDVCPDLLSQRQDHWKDGQ